MVNASLGYATYANYVLRYDGSQWTQWGDPLGSPPYVDTLTALWASAQTVLVGAYSGQAYVYTDSSPAAVAQSGLPKSAITAAWGFGGNDLWIGNSDGQLLHYDGTSWSVGWAGTGDCRAIRQMWGANGVLYFITSSSIATSRDGKVQMLAEYPCGGAVEVHSLWGNSDSEVFFALTDARLANNSCGDVRVLWFDGIALSPI